MQRVKCMRCEYLGDESEFPHGVDFLQKPFIAACPKSDNNQNPGDASMRMFGGDRPFYFVEGQPSPLGLLTPVERVLRASNEAS